MKGHCSDDDTELREHAPVHPTLSFKVRLWNATVAGVGSRETTLQLHIVPTACSRARVGPAFGEFSQVHGGDSNAGGSWGRVG